MLTKNSAHFAKDTEAKRRHSPRVLLDWVVMFWVLEKSESRIYFQ